MKYPGRVKVAGTASHVWALRDQRTWAAAPPADVAAEVIRGQKAADTDRPRAAAGADAEMFA